MSSTRASGRPDEGVTEPPGDGDVGRPLRRVAGRERIHRHQEGRSRHRPVAGVHPVQVAADGQQDVRLGDQRGHLGFVRRQPDRARVRALVQGHTWDSVARQIAQQYHEVLHGARGLGAARAVASV